MRRLMSAMLMGAALLPAAVQAQSQEEIRDGRREVRQGQREVREDIRRGDWREAREDAREVREDRRELREDIRDRDRRWGRDDWRANRDRNRAIYARGRWQAPFRYNAFRPGVRIAPNYYGRTYWIADPWRYHLPPAYGAQRWVRHYDDLLLVDTRRGVVLDVIRRFYS